MSAEAAFLASIRATPYDALTRLVYADWLDDDSRPGEASYLRWQAGLLANVGPDDLDPSHDLFRQFDPVEAELWRTRLRAFDPSWVARVHLDFAAPPNLPPGGAEAVEAVVELLASRGEWDTDGAAPAFRAPAEWQAGGSTLLQPPDDWDWLPDYELTRLYGVLTDLRDARWPAVLLVVFHRAGCLRPHFRIDRTHQSHSAALTANLDRRGLVACEINEWFSAILPLGQD